MDKKVIQTSDINIKIGLKEEKLPVRIDWEASDNPNGKQVSKAMLLAFIDEETKDTLKIDLWTTEMQGMETNRLLFQTHRGIADTYYKATQNAEMATSMQQFVHFFGEKTGIIKPGQ